MSTKLSNEAPSSDSKPAKKFKKDHKSGSKPPHQKPNGQGGGRKGGNFQQKVQILSSELLGNLIDKELRIKFKDGRQFVGVLLGAL